jgi:hypothetical protein
MKERSWSRIEGPSAGGMRPRSCFFRMPTPVDSTPTSADSASTLR